MNGIGVSPVSAYTAHREWATRPAARYFLPPRDHRLRNRRVKGMGTALEVEQNQTQVLVPGVPRDNSFTMPPWGSNFSC